VLTGPRQPFRLRKTCCPGAAAALRFVARGDSDDQVVGVIRGHMASDHPALRDTVTRDDLLSWIVAE